MAIITDLQPQQRRGGKRVNVFVDDRFAFSVDQQIAETLKVGQRLEDGDTATVLERDQYQRGLDAALAYLGHRPRSEREIRRRLAREELPPTTQEQILDQLRRWQLVDDAAFAQYWVEQRQSFRPRGARLLTAELRQRGVSAELAANATTELAEDQDAYRAAERKARQLAALDEHTFKQRLQQFLGRRGFGWDTISPTVQRLWREYGAGAESDDP